MRVASIDIGSNSILLLIAEKAPEGRWRRVEEHTEVARIAEGLDAHGVLQKAAVERASVVLSRFVERARALDVETILLTGTAPFRRAHNGQDVADAFERMLGVPFMVASGHQEGTLTLRATIDSFPQFPELRVLDIGGASTELMYRNDEGVSSQSVDIGVVRMFEKFVDSDPPREASLHKMQAYIRTHLGEGIQRVGDGAPVVGVGGTITSLAALDLNLEKWDPDAVQGHTLSVGNIEALGRRLWPMSVQERCDILGVDSRRADIIGVGAWFLYAICQHLNVAEVMVSDRGLRWGRIFAWDEEQCG